MIAGTLAAQVLTLPVIIYHFHQFPLLFLVANLIAIPWSSAILIAELVLLVTAFISPLAHWIGALTELMIWALNTYVERLNQFSFAVWNGLLINIPQLFLLIGFTAGIAFWLLEKNKKALWPALFCLLAFSVFRFLSITEATQQKALIVYNVPKHQAIDVIEGQQYHFIGDAELELNGSLRNFHLQPSRILQRTSPVVQPITKSFTFYGKKIWIIDTTLSVERIDKKPPIDLLVLSHNPRLYLKDLLSLVEVKQVVVDGSVPFKKKMYWRKDCDSLHIPFYDVTEKGAFVMKLQ
jgi:competence protein ComEC